jgi:hypothetical protein
MTWDIPAMVQSVTGIVSKLVPDRDLQIKIQHEVQTKLLEMQANQLAAQTDINKVEAQHSSVFVAGARPFIMWVCGFGLAWEFVLAPIVSWTAALSGYAGSLPEIAGDRLFELVLAMLGMAGWRTFDKIKGVDTKRIEVRKATRA